MKYKVLKSDFFNRKSIYVAKDLIGKYLVRIHDGKVRRYKIIETESYGGFNDKASKSHRGLTPGNAPMFGKPGMLYVYFTYGMHWMLNITCDREDYPGAVLIRGVEGIIGPGRITKRLEIDKRLNNLPFGKKSGIWIEEEKIVKKIKVKRTPRIGIDSSGPVWSLKLYRFVIDSPDEN